MEAFAALAFAVKLLCALTATAAVVVTTNYLNTLNNKAQPEGSTFDVMLTGIREDPRAAATYYAGRFLGICIMNGMILS